MWDPTWFFPEVIPRYSLAASLAMLWLCAPALPSALIHTAGGGASPGPELCQPAFQSPDYQLNTALCVASFWYFCYSNGEWGDPYGGVDKHTEGDITEWAFWDSQQCQALSCYWGAEINESWPLPPKSSQSAWR